MMSDECFCKKFVNAQRGRTLSAQGITLGIGRMEGVAQQGQKLLLLQSAFFCYAIKPMAMLWANKVMAFSQFPTSYEASPNAARLVCQLGTSSLQISHA